LLPNTEYVQTLINGLKEFVGSKIKSMHKYIDSLPQANWSQNDALAKDYVKNRTHWTEINKYEYTGLDGVVMATHYMQDPIPEIWIDGVKYTDIPVNHSDSDSRVSWFIVGEYRIDLRYTSGGVISSITPEVDNAKIIVYDYIKTVHKLPDEYIPEWVANVEDIPDVPAQEQANWDETDANAKSYIRNKPLLDEITVYRDWVPLMATTYTIRGRRLNILFSTNGQKMPLLPAVFSGTQHTILSIKTGKALTETECPYGAIMLMFGPNNAWCLNPL
jgi:hypothetical protein